MADDELSYEAAAARLDRAFARLELSARAYQNRLRSHQRSEAETQRLLSERARFAADLDKTSAKAKRLDESAAEVGRRLVTALETVRAVLVK